MGMFQKSEPNEGFGAGGLNVLIVHFFSCLQVKTQGVLWEVKPLPWEGQ